MSSQKVVTAVDDRGVATVQLNNPERRNAFDDKMIVSLTDELEEMATNRKVRLVILSGAGEMFCAGGDLGWMKRTVSYTYEENLEDARRLASLFQCLNFLPQPTIARIQGGAFGGGVGLVACCDIPVAAADSFFALSEVKIGLIPATISPYVLAAVGQRNCRRLFVTGERFDARFACQIGLVSQVVEADRLDSAVEKLVAELLTSGPEASVEAKKLALDPEERIDERRVARTSQAIAEIRVSSQGQEGLQAFLDKRQPDWSKA